MKTKTNPAPGEHWRTTIQTHKGKATHLVQIIMAHPLPGFWSGLDADNHNRLVTVHRDDMLEKWNGGKD